MSTAIGWLIAALAFIILILCIRTMSLVKAAMSKPKETTISTIIPQSNVPNGVSGEVLAAITAAVAAVWQSDSGFVVRHVKRIHNAPAWNRAGREEQTYSRF